MVSEPLYIHIIRDLEKKIKTGVFPGDSFIPTEKELQETYQTSRTTVRRAVSELINSGYLTVIRGVGTKVMPSRLSGRIHELTSFTQLMRSQRIEPGTRETEIQRVVPGPEVRKALEYNGDVIRISRLRTGDGTPISLNISFIPAHLLRKESPDIFAGMQSLYDVLDKKLAIRVTITEDTYRAIPADASLAKKLGIRKNDPLLLIERTAFDRNRQIVEYSLIYLRADRYRHTVTLRVK